VPRCRRDWGFVICGNDLPGATASFDDGIKETLVLSAEAGDTVAEDGEQQHRSARSSTGGYGSGSGSADDKPLSNVLTHAFKRLQEHMGLLRTQSEPPPEVPGAPKSPGADGGKPQCVGLSEPASPMLGAEALPDNIHTISTAARRQSSEFRVPSIQAGLRPW
jgi:hypothetical protein